MHPQLAVLAAHTQRCVLAHIGTCLPSGLGRENDERTATGYEKQMPAADAGQWVHVIIPSYIAVHAPSTVCGAPWQHSRSSMLASYSRCIEITSNCNEHAHLAPENVVGQGVHEPRLRWQLNRLE